MNALVLRRVANLLRREVTKLPNFSIPILVNGKWILLRLGETETSEADYRILYQCPGLTTDILYTDIEETIIIEWHWKRENNYIIIYSDDLISMYPYNAGSVACIAQVTFIFEIVGQGFKVFLNPERPVFTNGGDYYPSYRTDLPKMSLTQIHQLSRNYTGVNHFPSTYYIFDNNLVPPDNKIYYENEKLRFDNTLANTCNGGGEKNVFTFYSSNDNTGYVEKLGNTLLFVAPNIDIIKDIDINDSRGGEKIHYEYLIVPVEIPEWN